MICSMMQRLMSTCSRTPPAPKLHPPQVGAIEGGLEHDAALDEQLLAHVMLHARGGSGRQGHEGYIREHVLEGAQLLVVGSGTEWVGDR